jgi:hypothetical protein
MGGAKATQPKLKRGRAHAVPQLNKASCSYAQVYMRKLAMCFVTAICLILRSSAPVAGRYVSRRFDLVAAGFCGIPLICWAPVEVSNLRPGFSVF